VKKVKKYTSWVEAREAFLKAEAGEISKKEAEEIKKSAWADSFMGFRN